MFKSFKSPFTFLKNVRSRRKKDQDEFSTSLPQHTVNSQSEPLTISTSNDSTLLTTTKSKKRLSKLLRLVPASPTTTPGASTPTSKQTFIYSELANQGSSVPISDSAETVVTAPASPGQPTTEIESFDIGVKLHAHDLGSGISASAVPMGSLFPSTSVEFSSDPLARKPSTMGKTAAAIAAVQKKEKRISWRMPEVSPLERDKAISENDDVGSIHTQSQGTVESLVPMKKINSISSVSRQISEAISTPIIQSPLQGILKASKLSTVTTGPERRAEEEENVVLARTVSVTRSASGANRVYSPRTEGGETFTTDRLGTPCDSREADQASFDHRDNFSDPDVDKPLVSDEEFLSMSLNSNSKVIPPFKLLTLPDRDCDTSYPQQPLTPSSGSRFKSLDRFSHNPFKLGSSAGAESSREVQGTESIPIKSSSSRHVAGLSRTQHLMEQTPRSSGLSTGPVPILKSVAAVKDFGMQLAASMPISYLASQPSKSQSMDGPDAQSVHPETGSAVDPLAYLNPDEKALIEEYRRRRLVKHQEQSDAQNLIPINAAVAVLQTARTNPSFQTQISMSSSLPTAGFRERREAREQTNAEDRPSMPAFFLKDQKKVRSISLWAEESHIAGPPPEHPHQLHVHQTVGDHPHHEYLPESLQIPDVPPVERTTTVPSEPERKQVHEQPLPDAKKSEDTGSQMKRRKSKRKPLVDLNEPSLTERMISLRRNPSQSNKAASKRNEEASPHRRATVTSKTHPRRATPDEPSSTPLERKLSVSRKASVSRRSKRITPKTTDDSSEENLPLGELIRK